MAEEDQESHFDDPEEAEPIKVSVTFKPQEPETDVKLLDNTDDQALDDKSAPENRQQADKACYDSETKESRLPINPPVTPIPSYLDVEKVNREGHEADQPEVLEVRASGKLLNSTGRYVDTTQYCPLFSLSVKVWRVVYSWQLWMEFRSKEVKYHVMIWYCID